jgi:hypothetical protein
MKTTLFLPVLLLTLSCSIMPAKKIYVSTDGNDANNGSKELPFKTLDAAQGAIRTLRNSNSARSIKVILGEGTWFLTQPLVFTQPDGGAGKTSVTWEGHPSGKTIISGGQLIDGFRDAGLGMWWANIDSSLYFEQLYVDGVRATRARIPNKSDSLPRIFLDRSRWVYNPDSSIRNITVTIRDRGYLKDLITSGDFEMVIFKDWTISRFRASGLQSDPAEIFLKPPFALFEGSYNSIFAGSANHYSCHLEGDPAFLDEAGEWALDKEANRLYYKPLAGQVPESTIITAARSEKLIVLNGTRENPIENLEFKNISFQHAAYILPPYSHDGAQACFYYPGQTGSAEHFRIIPEAIRMKWSRNCSFTHCNVIHTAGNGIFMEEGCANNLLADLNIEDFGGNGVMIGLPVDPKKDSLALPRGNLVYRSTIHSGGIYFQGAVGIWLGFGANNELSTNEIYDMPYTGISVGWQWNPLPTSSKDNRILQNKIHQVMQVLGDGGGIYTLGFQPGSIISGNEIYDILRSELNHASPNNGMFIDEGSKGYLVENNTIRNTAHTCIRGHRAAGVHLAGNTFYTTNLPAISHTPPYEAMIYADQDTTITWPNPGWPGEWGYPDRVTAFTMERNVYIRK